VEVLVAGYAQLKLKKICDHLDKSKEQIFEIPTGGYLCVENLLYLARKEQCLALGTQLRTFKINNYKIYRIFPSGEVQYLHPKDGVFLKKIQVGLLCHSFSIGKNQTRFY
jgi:photosystem I subunit 2